jgi:hypothetical protein
MRQNQNLPCHLFRKSSLVRLAEVNAENKNRRNLLLHRPILQNIIQVNWVIMDLVWSDDNTQPRLSSDVITNHFLTIFRPYHNDGTAFDKFNTRTNVADSI